MKNVKLKHSISHLILSLSSALVFSAASFAADNNDSTRYAADNAPSSITEQQDYTPNFTEPELEQMLAPIALYPDALLSHILIATTYPLEVVDAERWLNQHSQLSAQALADAAEENDWDASVKALLPFPTILKKLSDDLRWMSNLGDAFLQDEAQVLTSIQILRKQADQAGNLKSMDNVNVVRESQTIIIESRQPDIIYVPYYDTRVVYGNWRWSHHPPIFWHHPEHYAWHRGAYYWHNPVHLTVGLFFGAVHWNNHHVVVHHHKSRYYKHHSNKKVAKSYQATRWQHNPRHRKGVAYRSAHIENKYRNHASNAQHKKVLRANQKHRAKDNKIDVKQANRQHSASKIQSLKHKLQVNRAVKIDKHEPKKNSLTHHEPYKSKQWQKSAPKVHAYKGAVKSSSKLDKNKHNPVKNYTKADSNKHDNQQRKHVVTNKSQAEKSYIQPVTTPKKNSYDKSVSAKTEKRRYKRSNTHVTSDKKHRTSSKHQSRIREHNK